MGTLITPQQLKQHGQTNLADRTLQSATRHNNTHTNKAVSSTRKDKQALSKKVTLMTARDRVQQPHPEWQRTWLVRAVDRFSRQYADATMICSSADVLSRWNSRGMAPRRPKHTLDSVPHSQ